MFLISVYLNVLEKTFRRPPGSDLLSHRSVNFSSRLCIFVSLSPTPVIPVLDNLSTGSPPCLPSPRPSALSILSISTTAPRTEVWLPLPAQAGPWAAQPPAPQSPLPAVLLCWHLVFTVPFFTLSFSPHSQLALFSQDIPFWDPKPPYLHWPMARPSVLGVF